MKRLSVVVGFLCCCCLPVHAELSLKEIRTASNNVLVAYFKSNVVREDEVKTGDVSAWKLNGQALSHHDLRRQWRDWRGPAAGPGK